MINTIFPFIPLINPVTTALINKSLQKSDVNLHPEVLLNKEKDEDVGKK